MGLFVGGGGDYTPMVGGGEANILQTYNTEGVSAPNISVTSPVDSSTMTASELSGDASYSNRVESEVMSAFGPIAAPSEANGYSTEGWATSGTDAPDWYLNGEEPAPEAETSVIGGLWKEFKSLDGKTQSVLASSLFSAIGGVMKNDTAKETNKLNRERLDLERQKQNNAMQSTAESYDKSKYKVRGLLNPEAKLTYSTQTGVKK